MLGWFKKRAADPQAILKSALGDYELPSFPMVVMEAMRKLRDPNAGIADIGDVLARDPGVTARLLKVANSPVYGLRHPVKNVHHAASLLGRAEVEALLLSVGVRSAVPSEKLPGFDPRRFWRSAARRATCAKALAQRLHPATRSESFTAALLEDLAVPLLASVQGKSYCAVLEDWRLGGEQLDARERDLFGWDHAVVGASMCDRWGFPERLTIAIGSHHAQDDADVPAAVALVALLREPDGEPEVDELVADAERRGLPADEVVELVRESFDQADGVAAALAA